MGVRYKVKLRGGAVVVMSAALLVALTGCGDAGTPKSSPSTPAAKNGASSAPSAQPKPSGAQSSEPPTVVATSKGEAGIVLDVYSTARDTAGFVTVSGQIKNTGDKPFGNTAPWRGNELKASGVSMAGVTLVDKAGKKRYYVLRDTDGRCLCTTGVVIIEAGQSVPFFAQFPAPPATTSEVEFSFPTFASVTLKISG